VPKITSVHRVYVRFEDFYFEYHKLVSDAIRFLHRPQCILSIHTHAKKDNLKDIHVFSPQLKTLQQFSASSKIGLSLSQYQDMRFENQVFKKWSDDLCVPDQLCQQLLSARDGS